MGAKITYVIVLCLVLLAVRYASGNGANDSYKISPYQGVFQPKQQEQENGGKETDTCQQADDDQLPPDLFTDEQLKHGAVVLHVFAAIYFFTLLAVVCNDYFLPAVECICQDLHLPKDVAAATFMATATTMPEFFTNSISTLVTNSNMGIGTIIGSLMFNTLGVAALSGVALSKSMQLDWWPVTRDCIFYSFNILVLIIVAWGGFITFWESFVMVILCVTYYIVMFLNNKVVKHARVLVEDKMNCCSSNRYDLTSPATKPKLPALNNNEQYQNGVFVISQQDVSSTTNLTYNQRIPDENTDAPPKKPRRLFHVPEGSTLRKFWWAYTWPIKAILTCLVPSPKTNRRFYPLTFIMCILFIGANSYMIVWMLTVFANTINVNGTVMGLTFLAAGATMPEALSSLISVRKGDSGVGVSNALGANSLAILLSLGVPWFIKNAMNYNREGCNYIKLESLGIEYAILILLLSTWSLFIVLRVAKFRLRRTVGLILFAIYAVFITLQILIQTHVFFPETKES